MRTESLYIILNQFRKEHITEEEAIQLIEDLYRQQNVVWWYNTHHEQQFPSYEVTCQR